jgi:acetolactate synthase regulatory subunit
MLPSNSAKSPFSLLRMMRVVHRGFYTCMIVCVPVFPENSFRLMVGTGHAND